MTESRRALMPDDLRLVAPVGIVVVNVQYIAFASLHDHPRPLSPWPLGRLVRLGAALLLVQVVIAPTIRLSIPGAPADMIAREREIMTRGSVAELMLVRAIRCAFALPVFVVSKARMAGHCRPDGAGYSA